MKNKNKGFTLIELMVVISIIGVLSSVVLAGLQSTRVKARNSRIVQGVQQLRNQIELTRSGDSYPSLLGSTQSSYSPPPNHQARHSSFTTNLNVLVTDILKQNNLTYPTGYSGNSTSGGGCGVTYDIAAASNALTIYIDNTTCGAATKYAIYAAMGPVIGSSGYFCIDSAGKTTKTTSGAILAPSTVATCQ